MTDTEELGLGDSVIDREDDDPSEAIVIWRPEGRTITDWEYEKEGETLTTAEENPGYAEDEQLVVVAYRNTLDNYWPAWEEADLEELYEGTSQRDINQYGFPRDRLRAIEPGELEAQWLDGLADRLADAGWDVTREPTELVVEQFGEQYRITADASVEGGGNYQTPLETLVENYRS
jgi:hypothetical protein